MRTTQDFVVEHVEWSERAADLQSIRRAVFVVEQRVPEEEEWDDRDAASRHVLAIAAGTPVGTGRLLPDARIGRMAVLKSWRGRGIGSAMLTALLDQAQQRGFAVVKLHAQTHALEFYAKHGFTAVGAEFMEAGIPHREMRLVLKPERENGA